MGKNGDVINCPLTESCTTSMQINIGICYHCPGSFASHGFVSDSVDLSFFLLLKFFIRSELNFCKKTRVEHHLGGVPLDKKSEKLHLLQIPE